MKKQALPFYWKKGRVDSDKQNEPFFGCFDCLDEFEEEYSIACSECTGQGSVHSKADLVSRSYVKEGKENAEAYELAKQNYHRYLSEFLVWYVYHKYNIYRVQELTAHELVARGFWHFREDVYNETMAAHAPSLWKRGYLGRVLDSLLEKTVAELKCRLDKDHPPKDRFGLWEKNETHLAEHCPYLNNVTTSLKRAISEETLDDMSTEMNVLFDPVEADDEVDGESQQYNDQPFLPEMGTYDGIMERLSDDNIRGPRMPNGLPYEILEFVPQLPSANFDSRIDRLKMDLLNEVTQCEIKAPRGDESVRGGRDIPEYWRNENFVDNTVGFIFGLLALDPGLSRVRMLEIGKLFHSVLLEPWYFEYGHGERQAGESAEGNEQYNMELRGSIMDLANVTYRLRLHDEADFVNNWWGKTSYRGVIRTPPPGGPGSIDTVFRSASNRWGTFYSNWLQILANVELSHTKLTQEQLDADTTKSCPVCADDYEVGDPNNCAVWIECGNNHTMCKKCYTQLSLTPTRPYNDLMTTRNCPQCRNELQYEKDMKDLTDGLNLMPSLNIDFPYHD